MLRREDANHAPPVRRRLQCPRLVDPNDRPLPGKSRPKDPRGSLGPHEGDRPYLSGAQMPCGREGERERIHPPNVSESKHYLAWGRAAPRGPCSALWGLAPQSRISCGRQPRPL